MAGRPKKSATKSYMLRIRMTEQDRKLLEVLLGKKRVGQK
jgi:hypothetical protein